MPGTLKKRALMADAAAMSDTALTTNETEPAPAPTETPSPPVGGFFLDGDAPRLGSSPLVAPSPLGAELQAPVTTTPAVADEPRFAENAPDIDEADMPTLPTVDPAAAATPLTTEDAAITDVDDTEPTNDDTEPTGDSGHPMAHLMPAKSKPTEASRRAAELRAEKQAKAKKIKIGVAIGAVVVTAAVGPPLWSWLSNAVNEAGSTTTEQPDG